MRLQPAIARQFADLSRDARRLRLSGWEPAEVAECLRLYDDDRLSLELSPAIQRLTEGNPFFVKEVAREIAAGLLQPATLLDDTTPMPLPDGVRETIQRRLADLPEELRPLLRLAALIGREFDGAALHRLANQRAPIALSELAALLAHAVAAGLVTETHDRAGSYAFSHALVRETLRNEVSPIERMSLHLAIGEALEGDGGDEEMAARLAYHFFQANAAGGAAKAVHYARLAAAAAERASAYEGAAALTQRALDALRFLPPDEPRRCELLIALGRAERRAGRIPEARAAFRRAAQIARDIGEVDLAATAALGFGQVGETGRVDADLTRLLGDSLTLLGETDSALRCRVLARLAMALYFSTDAADGQRRDAMSADAVQMARRLGDREALGATLVARHFVLWRPGTTAERLALSAELIELALSLRDEELELEARLWHALDLLESGNGPGYAAAIEAFRRLAGTAKLPIYEWHLLVLDALWALACGELDAAARAAEAARDLDGDYHIDRAAQFFAAQMFFHRRDRGELAELEPALRAFADQLTALPVWRCGLALLYADVGRTAEAERGLAGGARHGSEHVAGGRELAAVPRDAGRGVRHGRRPRRRRAPAALPRAARRHAGRPLRWHRPARTGRALSRPSRRDPAGRGARRPPPRCGRAAVRAPGCDGTRGTFASRPRGADGRVRPRRGAGRGPVRSHGPPPRRRLLDHRVRRPRIATEEHARTHLHRASAAASRRAVPCARARRDRRRRRRRRRLGGGRDAGPLAPAQCRLGRRRDARRPGEERVPPAVARAPRGPRRGRGAQRPGPRRDPARRDGGPHRELSRALGLGGRAPHRVRCRARTRRRHSRRSAWP